MPGEFINYVTASSLTLLALITLMFVIYSVWSYFRLRKQRNSFAELHAQLAPGKSVVFCGGLFGTIRAIRDELVDIEVSPGVTIAVSRYAIQKIASKASDG